MRQILDQHRNDIIVLTRQGLPTRKISSKLWIGKSTVRRIRKKVVLDQELPLKGRPYSINARQENHIVRSLVSGRMDTAADV